MTEHLIRLAHTRFGAGSSPASLAIEMGLMAARGIEVDRRELDRPDDIAAAVVSRDADIAICGGTAVLGAAMAGGDPVILRSIEGQNRYAIIGARSISSPEELRGAAFGVVGHLEVDHMIARRALRQWGIDPDVGVRFRACGSRGAAWDALLAGDVNAMASAVPQPLLARKVGLPVLKDYCESPEPFQMGALVTTRRFADARPELLRGFLAAIEQAVTVFCSDFEVSLPHLQARSKLQDVEILRETHRLFSEALQHGVPSLDSLRTVADEVTAATGESIEFDLAALIDTSFLPDHPALKGSTHPNDH